VPQWTDTENMVMVAEDGRRKEYFSNKSAADVRPNVINSSPLLDTITKTHPLISTGSCLPSGTPPGPGGATRCNNSTKKGCANFVGRSCWVGHRGPTRNYMHRSRADSGRPGCQR
jgi:hypothetical protein